MNENLQTNQDAFQSKSPEDVLAGLYPERSVKPPFSRIEFKQFDLNKVDYKFELNYLFHDCPDALVIMGNETDGVVYYGGELRAEDVSIKKIVDGKESRTNITTKIHSDSINQPVETNVQAIMEGRRVVAFAVRYRAGKAMEYIKQSKKELAA